MAGVEWRVGSTGAACVKAGSVAAGTLVYILLLARAEHAVDGECGQLGIVDGDLQGAVPVHLGDGFGERGILEEEASVAPAGDLCDVDGVDQVPSSLGPGLGWG